MAPKETIDRKKYDGHRNAITSVYYTMVGKGLELEDGGVGERERERELKREKAG